MTTLRNRLVAFVNFFHALKDESLQWRLANQDQQIRLKHAQALAEEALVAQLKKKSVQLAHEIAMLKIKNDTELSMLKTRCKQDIKDYKQYLDALDQLKHSIQTSYTHLPEAVAFTIHHHAKHLMNKMWEAQEAEQKMHHEIQLINFMTTVHEDARLQLEEATTEKLPERTLRLIQHR